MRVRLTWAAIVLLGLASCTEGAEPEPRGATQAGASGSAGMPAAAGSPASGGGGTASVAGAGGALAGAAGATSSSGSPTSAGAGAGGMLATGGNGGSGGGGQSGSAGAGGAVLDHSLPGKLVVLGSSTSAGTGPKDPNNAYVVRYQAYLAQQFPHFTLVNLAVGGQTTYHIQPNGFAPPANRPAPVEGKNITAALALKPDAILVNMPSNDTAANIPASEQLANLERVAALAKDAHILVWVTTTQPRDFANAAQIMVQEQVRDSILTSFASRTLDFWTPFATSEGKTKSEFGAGDGVHLNDAAHAILRDIVIAAQIPETVLAAR